MSRHHPYGGPYDGPGPRRGGSPAGPGPDRSHRFHDGPPRGRGFGRGRGRGGGGGGGGGGGPYGGYDGAAHNAYDQAPPQGDMGAYNGYDAASQDPFYQSTGFDGPDQYGGPGSSGGFNNNYGGFEDDSGANFGPGGYGNRPSKRGSRRERDDKVHESIIEERIQRERPCRTLFIRNIKYETNSDDVRRQFEEHGEIKTFFDLIANRGMVFVTFFDLRAAERARERLQGSEISGRPIDVHYSLPRDDSTKGSAQNQELQGSLLVTLRNSMTGQPIDDNEVRRKFQQFGDVKAVRPTGERSDQRYVEFYDIRSAEEAFDRLRHQGLQDGVMDIVLAWEETAAQQPGPPRRDEREQFGRGDWDDGPRGHPPRGRGRGRGKRGGGGGGGGGFAGGGGGGGGGGGHDDERRPWERDRDRPRRRDDDHGGRGGGRGGYGGDRFDHREGGYGGPGPSPGGGYGGPSAPPSYGPPPVTMQPPVDERLDQARKVQQLLAALKQPQNGAAPATPPSQPQPPAAVPTIPPPAPPAHYYQPPPASQQPHAPYPGPMPPAPAPGGYPHVSPPSQPQPASSAIQNLPPNLLALLHGVQAQQPPSRTPPQMPPQQGQYSMPPAPGPGGMMPPMPGMPGGPPMPPGSDYQQLMTYLAAAKRA